MSDDTVRLNITIPKDLAHALDHLAGPRKRSRFIVEALREKIKKKEKEDLELLLTEGYQATSEESTVIANEFESADLEGWDDY